MLVRRKLLLSKALLLKIFTLEFAYFNNLFLTKIAHKAMDTSISGADGYLDVTVFQSLFKEASIMAAFEHENVLRYDFYSSKNTY